MQYKEKQPLNYEQAKEKALNYLEYRSHSEKELTEKLIRAGTDREIAEQVMDFLKEYRLVNDFEYARRYSRDLFNLKQLGKNRIITELKLKGISSEYIDTVIEELPEREENVLLEMVNKRLKGDYEKKSKDRVIRYFINKGYRLDEIKECINNLEENDLKGIE